jgi:hypothetical protein
VVGCMQAATEAQQMLLLPSSCMVGEDVMRADAQQGAQAAREQGAQQYQRDMESAAAHRCGQHPHTGHHVQQSQRCGTTACSAWNGR